MIFLQKEIITYTGNYLQNKKSVISSKQMGNKSIIDCYPIINAFLGSFTSASSD